jgi:RNA polymerase sigma factor for flagellar operon FliA
MNKQKKHKIKQDEELWKNLEQIRSSIADFQNDKEYKKIRSKLAELNYPIVLKLADLMHHKYPETDKDDLQGFGCIGLLDAIDKFDPYKNIQFETFATYRIFGSMYDEMRKLDWVPRLTRQRYSKVEKEREKFIIANGRCPTREELISLVPGESVLEKQKTVDDSRVKMSYSINNSSGSDDNEDFSSIHCDKKSDFFSSIDRMDFFNHHIVKNIDTEEAKFIYLVYYEGRTLKEAASMLGVKENRSSYLHDSIIKKLEKIFEKDKDILVS